jgi:CxxC motif-containing protein (DUF1111 family)
MIAFKKFWSSVGVFALMFGAMALVLSADKLWAALENSPSESDDLRASLLARPLTPNLGGDGTVDTAGPRAFRSIAANADNNLVAPFLFGQRMFDVVWDNDPVISPVLDGLGPMFNRTSCRECHEGNGRGHPPENVGDPMKSMLVRISIPGQGPHGGPNPVPNYGDQIQDRAIPGVAPEAQAIINYEEIPGEFADGTPYSLRKPIVSFVNTAYGDLPNDMLVSPRVAQPVIGLGLLQAVPVETLEALADPEDANGDGVSGRINIAWDAPSQQMMPGRFGWKANVPSLRHQTAGAALGDMGLTSLTFSENLCEPVQKECIEMAEQIAAKSDAPEIHPELFTPMEMYMLLLAVPVQRNADDPAVQRGEALFRGIGCSGCHMPTLVSGEGDLPPISNQEFHPFTDLLVHDMGEGLADNRPDYGASGSEWRTQPLWGIGLTYDVGAANYHLHDGRARSLSEAILWHGGEAEGRREAFRNLNKDQREDLLAFLGSL